MTDEPTPPPPRRKRKGGRRRKDGRPYTDPKAPFDPLSRTTAPLGQTYHARRIHTNREAMRVEAEFLARHFQMNERGKLPDEESAKNLSIESRRARIDRLTKFPPIPLGELERLQGIIARYGLPLAQMDSDSAAFVVRRVMLDFFRMGVLRRDSRPGLFTREELIELLRVMKLRPSQLAESVAGRTITKDAAIGNIDRWLHEAARPSGMMAERVNRLIEQHVRHPKRGGFPVPRQEDELVQEAETAKRRRRYRAQEERRAIPIPLAPSARENADATETNEQPPRAGQRRGGSVRPLQPGGP